jgi:ADP-dependent NAD(P)H-hydrate dehydratase
MDPMESTSFEIDSEFLTEKLPPRRRTSHKGMNGVVCVVGGSRTFHGAPFLCAMGAAKTGVDLVYLAVPAMIASPVRSLSPDLIVIPLPDSKLTRGNASKLAKWIPNVSSIGIGPGLGPQNPDELKRALDTLSGKCEALVVDADALRPQILDSPEAQKKKTIVTPHAGEFERLFGQKVPEDVHERVSAVRKAAATHGVVVLLKGATDVVSDGDRVAVNNTHSPAMTVGGTGDVLTGIAAGLAAKGVERFDAACCAIFINGLAGLAAAKELGNHVLASDVVARIPGVMKPFDKIE